MVTFAFDRMDACRDLLVPYDDADDDDEVKGDMVMGGIRDCTISKDFDGTGPFDIASRDC